MSITGFASNVDIRKALEVEEMILDHLPTTVGLDHPARQTTLERIEALKAIISNML